MSAGNAPNFVKNFNQAKKIPVRPSSTMSAHNAMINLYNPLKKSVELRTEYSDSKLILSTRHSRPFSPPQKQFIPTAQFHRKSAIRLLESKKNASKA